MIIEVRVCMLLNCYQQAYSCTIQETSRKLSIMGYVPRAFIIFFEEARTFVFEPPTRQICFWLVGIECFKIGKNECVIERKKKLSQKALHPSISQRLQQKMFSEAGEGFCPGITPTRRNSAGKITVPSSWEGEKYRTARSAKYIWFFFFTAILVFV